MGPFTRSARVAISCGTFETAKTFETVNGVQAKGGSIDAGGPTVGHGMAYTNSGYGQFGAIAGNVLLAFSVDGK